jgi:hypothetical protein
MEALKLVKYAFRFLEQWSSTWGRRTLGGKWKHFTGYMKLREIISGGTRTENKMLVLDNFSNITTLWIVSCVSITWKEFITIVNTSFQPASLKTARCCHAQQCQVEEITQAKEGALSCFYGENCAGLQQSSPERSPSRFGLRCLPEAHNCRISMGCLSRHVLHTFACCQMDVRLLHARGRRRDEHFWFRSGCCPFVKRRTCCFCFSQKWRRFRGALALIPVLG